MFSLFGTKSASHAVAIFDLGSGSVGSALVAMSEGKPHLIYTNRIPIPFQKNLDPEKFTKALLTVLMDSALDLKTVGGMRLKEHGLSHVTEASAVFASPWSVSEGITMRIKRDKEFTITKELIEDTVKAEAEKYATEREGELPALIERHAVGVLVNGYQFDDPYGKKTLATDISAFISFIPSALEKSARDIIQGALPSARIHAHSFPMALFSVSRFVFPELQHALLIDVRAEITDISVMCHGILSNTVSFPIGEHTILRMLGEGTSADESKLRLYMEGKANGTVSDGIEKKLAELKVLFTDAFKSALEPIAITRPLPEDVVLTGEGISASWFAETIGALNMKELMLGGGLLRTHLIDSSNLENAHTKGSEVRSDTLLTLESVFLDSLLRTK